MVVGIVVVVVDGTFAADDWHSAAESREWFPEFVRERAGARWRLPKQNVECR